jgi:4-alpha-glucanotransferase
VPGQALFSALTKAFGDMPVIAEDLGFITEDVIALRDGFHLPGLKILQFEFGNGPPTGPAHPKAYPANSVTYTGTHDNNTTLGWFKNDSADAEARAADASREASAALSLLGGDGSDIHWRMIELGLGSGSHLALFPLQDVLGLDGAGRMNVPGTIEGNWAWRFGPGDLTPELAAKLAHLTHTHDRLPRWHLAGA